MIADPAETILVPAVRPRPRLVVWKVLPGSAFARVVFADGSPGAFAQIRSPLLPAEPAGSCFFEPVFFLRHPVIAALPAMRAATSNDGFPHATEAATRARRPRNLSASRRSSRAGPFGVMMLPAIREAESMRGATKQCGSTAST